MSDVTLFDMFGLDQTLDVSGLLSTFHIIILYVYLFTAMAHVWRTSSAPSRAGVRDAPS